MKKFALEFLRRGAVACGFGPVILAIVYMVLQQTVDVRTLTVNEVCTGIFSLTALAFVAGGMNAVYQVEHLPLMLAVFLHGGILYLGYLGVYLINGWLGFGTIPIVVFSAIFAVGYMVIWAVIYSIIRRNTAKLNEKLKEKQKTCS